MQVKYVHIFINILHRNHDKYFGIRKQLLNANNHQLIDINLSQKSMKLFRKVEYGARKYFREFYYRPVFKELESSLIQSINSSQGNILVYLQDEGVWSEFLKFLIKKHNLHHVNFINVQHGFLMKNKYTPKRDKVIKLINSFYQLTFGFPKLGIGPFKGPFSHYLLFHEELIDEVPKSSKAIACPNLINRSFIDDYHQKTQNTKIMKKSVLIALQHNSLFGYFSYSFTKTISSIIPLIDSLRNNFRYDIFLRKHPGMRKKYFIKVLKDTGLYNKVIIDESPLEVSMKRSPYILSFFSTILFESTLVGRLPVIINNYSFSLNEFPLMYDKIDINENLEFQLSHIFEQEIFSNESKDEIDWVNLIEKGLDTSSV